MNPFQSNPFSVLSLIAAPAVLTNASSVLALGTSNRLARAVDRSRALLAELQGKNPEDDPFAVMRIRQVDRNERRAILMLGAMQAFYTALGCFAATSLISVLGASLADSIAHPVFMAILGVALAVGVVGVCSLVLGCSLVLRDTRLAVQNIHEEAEVMRTEYAAYLGPDPHLAADGKSNG